LGGTIRLALEVNIFTTGGEEGDRRELGVRRPERDAIEFAIERCRRSTAESTGSGGVAAPVGDFAQTFSAGMLKESDFVAGVFEFVDVGPDFGLPR
jgi:hypothetical protein